MYVSPRNRACFELYINTKVVKRLDTFRVRNAPSTGERRVLLPLSFGISSLTLLHVLDGHLQRQRDRTGHTGFSLSVVHVDCSPYETVGTAERGLDVIKAQVRERFPLFEIETIPIADVWDDVMPTQRSQDEESIPKSTPTASSTSSGLATFMASLDSTTSQTDMLLILRQRLIVKYAKERGFQSIFWGHSTTRIAERTLGETAKGRGLAVPNQFSDGPSPFGIPFYFPLRDLLRKEVASHSRIAEPNLFPLLPPADQKAILDGPAGESSTVVTKNTSIDSLMGTYFESVEASFPSIVSNVVRTTEKLNRDYDGGSDPCALCLLPIGDRENGNAPVALCYGCGQSISKESIRLLS